MARYMRGYGMYRLGEPIVGPGIAWHGPGTYLTSPASSNQQNRRAVHSRLEPPQVVTPAAVQIFFGPKVTLEAQLPERQRSRVTRRSPDYELKPPVILATNGTIRITLVHQHRAKPKSFLRPPTDTIGLEDQGKVTVRLAPGRRLVAKSRLSLPAVVTPITTQVFTGPAVHLRPSRRPVATYDLAGPIVLFVGGNLGWLATQLVQPPRRRTRSQLFNFIPPTVAVQVFYGPAIHLTRGRRGQPKSVLKPPTILATNVPPITTLAPQRRGRAKSVLSPPRVVFTAVELSGPEVTLARIRPPERFYRLSPPADITEAEEFPVIREHLAYSRRGTPKFELKPPSVVFQAVEIYGPVVSLTRIKIPQGTALLRPPTDITEAEEFPVVSVHRAYSRRGRPVYELRPPTDTVGLEDQGQLSTWLTYSRRGVAKPRLSPPTVVAPVVSYGPFEWLTYSRRGSPKSFLKPPAVISQPPAYSQVLPPTLTYSRRGRPIYRLRPPTVVFPFFARPTVISLAPATRGRPTYFLTPPTEVRTPQAGSVQITLAPQRRGNAKPFLKPPTVVRIAVEIYGPRQWLTYSRRPVTKSQFLPPTVVGRAPFRPILTSLAPSFRGRTTYFRIPEKVAQVVSLGPDVHLTRNKPRPTIVFRQPPIVRAAFLAAPVSVSFTRIHPPRVLYFLTPPAVVRTAQAFYGPLTHLVRIRPARVIHFRLPPIVREFTPPHGDVCGFDIAGSFVCSLEVPGSLVSGFDAPVFRVVGASQAGSKVTGSESAGGSVSGSDRKAT